MDKVRLDTIEDALQEIKNGNFVARMKVTW